MRRNMRDRGVAAGRAAGVVGLFVIASVTWAAADPLALLLHRWETRDGAAVFEVSYGLSQEFVRQPRFFLVAMSSRPEAWRSWLQGLPDQTFTVFIAGQKPQCEILRHNMLRAAYQLVADPEVGSLARELKQRLVKVKVREID